MSVPPSPAERQHPDPIGLLVEASEVAAEHPLDLDDLLRALADLVRKVVDYQLFAVLLADEEGLLRIRYSIGYRSDLVQNLGIRPGEGVTGHAAQSRKTVVVDDVRRDPRYLAAVDAVRSEIAVPLVARGDLVGIIDLQSTFTHAFGENERNMLELIGSRFSLAIKAAQLYQETVRQNNTLRTLSQIAQQFSQILDLEQLLQKIAALIREIIRYDAFSIYLAEPERKALKHYFGVRFDQRVQWRSLPMGKGVTGHAAATREPVLVRDTLEDARYVPMVEGIRSEVAAPLIVKDQVIGVLDLEAERVGWFTEEHVRTLTLLAPQIAAAIENARLYEQVRRDQERLRRDLAAARHLQKSLLPAGFPRFEGIEVAARSVSAVEVSGDLYDFYSEPRERFDVLCGDVTGKGAAAALYAALASGLWRTLVPEYSRPADLFAALNEALLARPLDGRYLVAMYAQWEPAEKSLTIASAGQPRPIVRLRGKVEALDLRGTPLGILSPGDFDETRLTLEPGDLFVTASDGLHETENSAGTQYGDKRLIDVIAANPRASARRLLDLIFADAREYSGRETPSDDRTVVVLRAV